MSFKMELDPSSKGLQRFVGPFLAIWETQIPGSYRLCVFLSVWYQLCFQRMTGSIKSWSVVQSQKCWPVLFSDVNL